MLAQKGQTSFEVVIIATLLIAMTASAVFMVPWITQTTGMMAIAKTEAIYQMNKMPGEISFIREIQDPVLKSAPEKDQIIIIYGGREFLPAEDTTVKEAVIDALVDKDYYSVANPRIEIILIYR